MAARMADIIIICEGLQGLSTFNHLARKDLPAVTEGLSGYYPNLITFYDKQGVLRCIKSRVFKSTCNGKIKKLHFLITRSIITPPGSAPYIEGLNRGSTIHEIP